jgi:GT2 family glycosyltransferase
LGTGCNLAVRRDLARALGGFDEALGAGTPAAGGEDYDMIFRVVEAGHFFAYDPEILVKHRHRAEMSALTRQLEGWGRGTVAFLVKSGRSRPEFRRAAASVIFWLLRHHARRLAKALRRSSSEDLPPSLVFAELRGCLRGTIAYRASQRYVKRSRAAGRGADKALP